MAIDQNARLGLPAAKTSCTSKPYTTTDFPLGKAQPGYRPERGVIGVRVSRPGAEENMLSNDIQCG
jgi:hypothetical protein